MKTGLSAAGRAARAKEKPQYRKDETLWCYLMIAMQIIGFLALTAYPIYWAARFAWYYYDGVASHMRFVGWENFATLFTRDSVYWKTWLVTFKFAAIKLPIELPFAMAVALILNKKIKGSNLFRALFYMPHIISVAIVGLIFTNMFDYFGVINAFLTTWGATAQGVGWFSSPNLALFVLAVASSWSTFGVNMIYFLAALQNVPEELYESAKLDGASRFVTFFKITLPMMAPVLQTVLLLAINGTLHANELVLVTTGGAPGGETFTVMSYIVSKFVPGFAQGSVNIGYGCATALVTSVFFCVIALCYSKLSKKMSSIY